MSDDQSGGNSGVAVAEPVVQGQAAPDATGTSDQTGQAATPAQSAPAEDSFSSIDPKTLPPELQAIHKQMQADYTKKTMSIADVRKKAEAFDKVASRSDFRDWWDSASKEQKADYKDQKAEVEKNLGQKISDEDFTKAFNSKEDFLSFFERAVNELNGKSQKKIENLEQQLSLKDAQDLSNSFATEIDKTTGKPLRPDFDDLEESSLISGYLEVNKPDNGSAQARLARLNEAYTWAKQVSQRFYEKGKAEALQIIQKKAAASSEPPTQAAKGAYTGPDPKKMTPSEAFQLAKKGIRVPRDD